MGIFCQIFINRPREGAHKAGRPVTGIVRYMVDEPGKYKDVVICLLGKGRCSWQEQGKHHHKRRNQTVTYVGRETYTAQQLSLHNKGPEGVFMLTIGTYERPFSFVLPNNIPSSFRNSICTIKYKLVIKFKKANLFSINQIFETEIDVVGIVYPITQEGKIVAKLEKTLFKPFKKKKHQLHLQTEIENSIFRTGDQIKLNYKVTNDSDVIVPSIKAEMICHTTHTSNCGRRKENSETIGECTVNTPSVPDNAIANMIDTMKLANSLYTIQHSRIIFNEYSIKVTLRLPMPYINVSLKIPIVIGEKYNANVEVFVPDTENSEDPPSYFQAMSESKEDKEND